MIVGGGGEFAERPPLPIRPRPPPPLLLLLPPPPPPAVLLLPPPPMVLVVVLLNAAAVSAADAVAASCCFSPPFPVVFEEGEGEIAAASLRLLPAICEVVPLETAS